MANNRKSTGFDSRCLPPYVARAMGEIEIIVREVTASELESVNSGFAQNAAARGVEVQSSDRFGTVAMAGDLFIGMASGLAYKNAQRYSGWFYLSDLFVVEQYRGRRIGSQLLQELEGIVRPLGIDKLWTWTAGYEAPAFYLKQGYEVFAELENYYSDGSKRIALRKSLAPSP